MGSNVLNPDARAESKLKDIQRSIQAKIDIAQKYRSVFSGPDGEIVLDDILAAGGILRSSFIAENSHETAFNEGQRAVALRILELMELDLKKLKERVEKNATRT